MNTVFAGIFGVVRRSFWYFKFFSAARLPEESAKGTIQYWRFSTVSPGI